MISYNILRFEEKLKIPDLRYFHLNAVKNWSLCSAADVRTQRILNFFNLNPCSIKIVYNV